jgi:hypothetical protein
MSDEQVKTTIIAISGKKSSGKSTASNFIHGIAFHFLGMTPSAQIDEDGKLLIETDEGPGIWDLYSRNPEILDYAANTYWPYIKRYSFADPIKEFCMDVLGLTQEQCYGEDADKNSPTPYLWDNMLLPKGVSKQKGVMTARQVMEFVGTDIFRRSFDNDVWAKAAIKRILKENPRYAIIDDLRFPNEVDAVKAAGGKVIRLTRAPYESNHLAETALDGKNELFDLIIDNSNMTITECHDILLKFLADEGFVEIREGGESS